MLRSGALLSHQLRPWLLKLLSAKRCGFIIVSIIRILSIKQTCCAMIDDLIDASQTSRPSNIFLIGDLNINLMCENDCKCLKDVVDIHGLCNLIESPTCNKSSNPSLIDVLLTSHKRRIANVLNINTGISDFHNLIACSTKMHVPRNTNRLIYYSEL